MKRIEWMNELKKNLSVIGESEREKALSFYAELFNDKFDSGMSEEEILRGFGDPRRAAVDIIRNSESPSAASADDYLTARYEEHNLTYRPSSPPPVPEPAAPVKLKKKKSNVFLRVILPIIVALVVACAVYSVVCTIIDNSTREKKLYTGESASYDKIVLDVSAADVTVVVGDSLSIEYETSAFCRVNIEEDVGNGNVLMLKQEHISLIGWSMLGTKITVSVPGFTELKADVGAGTIYMDGFDCEKIDLSSSAGRIDIRNCIASDVKLKDSAGEIIVDNLKADEFTAKSSAGAVNVKNSVLGKCGIETSAGGIGLNGVTADEYNFHASAGGLSFERLQINRSFNAEISAGGIKGSIVGTEKDFSVDIEVSAGSSNIRNSDRDTGKTIRARISAGGAEINFVS